MGLTRLNCELFAGRFLSKESVRRPKLASRASGPPGWRLVLRSSTVPLPPAHTIALRTCEDKTGHGGVAGESPNTKASSAKPVTDFTAVVGIDPDNWGALFGKGYARMLLGEYEGAMEDYDQVIRLRPDDLLVRHDRQIAIERAEAAGR